MNAVLSRQHAETLISWLDAEWHIKSADTCFQRTYEHLKELTFSPGILFYSVPMTQSSLDSAGSTPPSASPAGQSLWLKKLHFIVQATGAAGFWFVAIVGGSISFPILWFFYGMATYLANVCLRRVR